MSPRRLKLLQLVHGYPPAVGGVELSVRDLCEALVAEHNFDVTVLTTNAYTVANFRDRDLPTISADPDEVQNGVRIQRYPVLTAPSNLLKNPQRLAYRLRLPGNGVLRTLHDGPISPAMLRAARLLRPDVVCAASFPLNHMRYAFRLRQPAPPVVLIGAVHTNDPWGFDRSNLIRLVNRSFATVAHTAHERDWLVDRGAEAARIRVIGHGIDEQDLRPEPGAYRAASCIDRDGFLVAYVGQLAAHKGIDVLVRAFPELMRRVPGAWLAVGGSSTPFTPELERLIAGLPDDVRRRVRLRPDLTLQEKANLLGDCDVFASPSRHESFGITTLEAWSLGKAVVVGDSPSQRCIVTDGENGLIVQHGDEDGLVEALARLADPRVRSAMGRAGLTLSRASYQRRDIERDYAELLTEAAAKGQQGR